MTLPERFWDAEGFDVEGFDAALEAAEPVELEPSLQAGSEEGGRPSWTRSEPESARRPPMPMDALLTFAAVATVIAAAVVFIVILLMSPSAGWA